MSGQRADTPSRLQHPMSLCGRDGKCRRQSCKSELENVPPEAKGLQLIGVFLVFSYRGAPLGAETISKEYINRAYARRPPRAIQVVCSAYSLCLETPPPDVAIELSSSPAKTR